MRLGKFVGVFAALAMATWAQAPAGPQQNPPPSPPSPAPASPAPPRAPAAAQQPPGASVPIKTSTRLIAVDVVVTDSHGNVIRGLKADDFQVFEEHGAHQKI